jgi:hypothetical protein
MTHKPPPLRPCQSCGKESVVRFPTIGSYAEAYRLEKGKPVCKSCEESSQPYWAGKIVFVGKEKEMYEVC